MKSTNESLVNIFVIETATKIF